MTTILLYIFLGFALGSLAALALLISLDFVIRRRHGLHTEDQVDAALAAYRGGAR